VTEADLPLEPLPVARQFILDGRVLDEPRKNRCGVKDGLISRRVDGEFVVLTFKLSCADWMALDLLLYVKATTQISLCTVLGLVLAVETASENGIKFSSVERSENV
jgi:hypothetical protein